MKPPLCYVLPFLPYTKVQYLDIGSGCCDNKFTTNSVTLLGMELETGITKAVTDLLSWSARTHQLHKMKVRQLNDVVYNYCVLIFLLVSHFGNYRGEQHHPTHLTPIKCPQ